MRCLSVQQPRCHGVSMTRYRALRFIKYLFQLIFLTFTGVLRCYSWGHPTLFGAGSHRIVH